MIMIVKMCIATMLYILLTAGLWHFTRSKLVNAGYYFFIGIIYGVCSIISNHVSIDYGDMLLNVRDIGPLVSGVIFHPAAGIIAGLIGGIERYICGTYWGIGSYTRIACSISTCLAGFLAAVLKDKVFKNRLPSPLYMLFIGIVMEVFHMYVVLITHRNDMEMAFYVVKICAIPMILFTGVGCMGCACATLFQEKTPKEIFRIPPRRSTPLAARFQLWLFIVMSTMLIITFSFSYSVQTRSAVQGAKKALHFAINEAEKDLDDIEGRRHLRGETLDSPRAGESSSMLHAESPSGNFYLFLLDEDYVIQNGKYMGDTLFSLGPTKEQMTAESAYFEGLLMGDPTFFGKEEMDDGRTMLATMPLPALYYNRDMSAYETAFADVLLFTVIYVLLSILSQKIVVDNLKRVNTSLDRITDGHLDEVVNVESSLEFASLSSDINHTVDALKSYIEDAKKRIEEELMFARTVQSSSLPRVYTFPNRSELDLFASMNPAKEVGGDFYDFFFIDHHHILFVIADVSGKGIPASLFMMRGKTAIRSLAQSGNSPSEIFSKANLSLCEGNDADMFITSWIGILDLTTGMMQCANAGHEYPMLMRKGESFRLFKDKHTLALGVLDMTVFKEYTLQMNPGDKLFVYTDGIVEAINHSEDQFGNERLLNALNAGRNLPMNEMLPFVRQQMDLFVNGADQFDDVTMLGFHLQHLS